MKSLSVVSLNVFVYYEQHLMSGDTGWIVTYIINQRHGGHSSGYISSGFFGGMSLGQARLGKLLTTSLIGLMLGRVALLPVSKLVSVHLH